MVFIVGLEAGDGESVGGTDGWMNGWMDVWMIEDGGGDGGDGVRAVSEECWRTSVLKEGFVKGELFIGS